jgi:hypothetical protein
MKLTIAAAVASEEERVEVKKRKQVHVPWSNEESLLLKRLREKGEKWKEVVKSFPGRTEGSVKNFYSRYIIDEGEKRVQAAPWSKKQSLLLKKLREKGLSWKKISKSFPGRNATSCSTRYSHHIYQGENKNVAWSKKDELLLNRLKERGGTWENIAKSFPGRTASACQGRYGRFNVNEGEKRAKLSWSKEDLMMLKR